jgi:hypothetical protein
MPRTRTPLPTLAKHGGPRRRGQLTDAKIPMRGTGRDYLISRLAREGRADWLAAIAAGRLTPYAAAVELGWIRRAPTIAGERSHQAKRRRFSISRLIG